MSNTNPQKPSRIKSQQAFERAIDASGGEYLRNGWPDYLVRNEDGSFYAVEVKTPNDHLSYAQAEMLSWLASAGVDVYISDGEDIKKWGLGDYLLLKAVESPESSIVTFRIDEETIAWIDAFAKKNKIKGGRSGVIRTGIKSWLSGFPDPPSIGVPDDPIN